MAHELGFAPVRVRVQPRAGEELVIEPIVCSDDGADVLPCVLATGSDESSRFVLSIAEFEARVRGATQEHRPVLIFDQFEEILTLFEDADAIAARRALAEMIVRLLREPLRVKLLFVFREDYLGRIKQLLAACPELVDHALRLGAPSADQLETIIRGPFERFPGRFGRELDPALAEQLRAALAERFGIGEVSLSEVQTVCLRLWQSSDPAALLAENGVQGILEDDLGEALDALPTDLRAAAIALLGEMVTSAGTRNVISAEDLREHVREDDEDIAPQLLDEALERLERDSKLVRRERRHDLYLYEITSEFLVPWISKRREELHRDQERRRERRRLRIVASIAGALFIIVAIVAVLAIWALSQRSEAQRQANIAVSRELATRSATVLRADPGLSLALARRAVSKAPEEQHAVNALRQAVLGFRGLKVVQVGQPVNGADLSPDGRRAVSASVDGRVRIWNLRTGRPVLTVTAHRGEARAARFSPDGRTVASGGADGTLVVIEVSTGRRHVLVRNSNGVALRVAYSRDGDHLAAGYTDGTIRIAATRGARRVRVLRASRSGVFGVALSDDGKRVAGAGLDGTVWVWDLHGKDRPVILRGSGRTVTSVSFRPGHSGHLISADERGWLRFWNIDRGVQEGKVRIEQQAIFAAHLSRDGRRIVTANEDGAVRVIDAVSRRATAVLRGHTGQAHDVNFSAKGNQVISAGRDGTVRTWDPGMTRVMQGRVTNAAISSDGRRVVAGGARGIVRIWSAVTGRLQATLRGHSELSYAQFSPDDRRVLSVSQDDTVRVWRTADGKPLRVLRDHGHHNVYAAAIDHAGRRIASGGADNRIVVRDLTGGPVVRTGHTDAVNDVSFSPDDRLLLSAADDGTIRIWDARRAFRPLRVLRGHTGAVSAATFSPDGRKVLSAGVDGTLRVASLHGGDPIVLRGHNGAVESAAFNPSGTRIVSSGIDSTVRLWDPHGGEPLATLHAYRSRAWSASFSSDGADVLSSGDDSVWLVRCEVCGTTADILKLAAARAGRQLSGRERKRVLETP
jgi:WD40 repeat protein